MRWGPVFRREKPQSQPWQPSASGPWVSSRNRDGASGGTRTVSFSGNQLGEEMASLWAKAGNKEMDIFHRFSYCLSGNIFGSHGRRT